jgi:alpha-ketoglutaric semialdehyde dehydrogenase
MNMSSRTLTANHLIDGQWVSSASGATYQAVNPTTGQPLHEKFAIAGAPEVNAAMDAAAAAFAQTMELPPRWPAALLDAIAAAIMDLGDGLLERGEQETALPRTRLLGERTRTYNQLKMFAQIAREGSWVEAVIDTADPERKPAPKPDLRRMSRARGPVVVFGASNFPFAFGVCGGDTASALAAGNPVVVKGHPSHPGANELFASAVLSAIQSCNLPPGLFSLVQGKSHDLGKLLVSHSAATAAGFTGSQTAGRALFDIAAARSRPIPVYAEMGSLNPMVLLPGAMAERGETIAQQLAASILLGLGQFCTKPGLIFTVGDSAEKFIALLAKQMSAAPGGAMLNKTLRDSFCTRCGEFAKTSGVRTLVPGNPGGHASMGPSLWETDAKTWRSQPVLHEEAFGPGGLLIRCRDADEALDCLTHIQGSLTAALHLGNSDDHETAMRILRTMEKLAGRVIVNGYPTGVEVGNAIVHGGPYPATTDPGWTSVGSAAIRRFVRLVAYQDTPDHLLPQALQNRNPLEIERLVNGERTRQPL